jgi:hypothetical protein
MAKKRAMGQWTILPADQLVALRKDFAQSRKFRRGVVVALLSTEQEAIRHGGVYAIRPIDGPNTETLQQLPRAGFLPVTEKARVRRAKKRQVTT